MEERVEIKILLVNIFEHLNLPHCKNIFDLYEDWHTPYC